MRVAAIQGRKEMAVMMTTMMRKMRMRRKEMVRQIR